MRVKSHQPKRRFHHLSCKCCTTKDPNPADVKAYDKALAQIEEFKTGEVDNPYDPFLGPI